MQATLTYAKKQCAVGFFSETCKQEASYCVRVCSKEKQQELGSSIVSGTTPSCTC